LGQNIFLHVGRNWPKEVIVATAAAAAAAASKQIIFFSQTNVNRRAIYDGSDELCSEVERTILIHTEGNWELTFPSLYGTGRCLAKYEALQGVWQICVNPFLQIFEPRVSMKLKTGCRVRIPRKKTLLDFSWRNFEFADQECFKRAGTTANALKQQAIHSDHRRNFNEDLFSSSCSFNQNHRPWQSAQEWEEANLRSIPLPKTRPRPRSYLFSFAPKTSIRATPRGGGNPVSIAVPLGCFFCFDGNVTPLPAFFEVSIRSHKSPRNHMEETSIFYHIDACICMRT
jgi:hypothetical protein